MGHDEIKAALVSAARKLDADEAAALLRAEKWARQRASLEGTHVGRKCLWAAQALFDYSNGIPVAPDVLTDAAKTVLAAVQEELLRRREFPGSIDNVELAHARQWALAALRYRRSASDAKRLELAVIGPEPLTVCTGATLPKNKRNQQLDRPRTYNSRPPFLLGVLTKVDLGDRLVQVPTSGCLCIFPDTTQTSRRPWRYWCDVCERRRSRLEEQTENQLRSLFCA